MESPTKFLKLGRADCIEIQRYIIENLTGQGCVQ